MTDMTPNHNSPRTKGRRKALRRDHTFAERRLVSRLRDRQVADAKFRRQHAIDRYILDFYCYEFRLAIEIDGDPHFIGNAPSRDEARQRHIETYGITFLRFTNVEVFENIDGVLGTIYAEIQRLKKNEPSP